MSWTVTPIWDGDDCVIQLPEEFLKSEGIDWQVGDTIKYDLVDGAVIMSNLSALERKNGTTTNTPV